jgi:hypothetical protein
MARTIGVALAACIGAGCGSSSATPSAPLLDFPGPAALTVASASGALTLDVWWSPAHPTVGYDAAQLAIADASGAPVSGLALSIIPWMPADGHGASIVPTITETAPGVYIATPLDFFMAGSWELLTTIARSGDAGGSDSGDAGSGAELAIHDSAKPAVDVP